MSKKFKKNLEIQNEVNSLIKKLNRFNYEYYILNNSSISDNEYDKYMQELKNLESLYPEYVLKNSPTQQVGVSLTHSTFGKIKHSEKMYSLDNAFNIEELFNFDEKIKKLLNTNTDIEYISEMKIDGLSLNIKYDNGKLISAATRGDGEVGENITVNILNNITIPKTIDYNDSVEVRGEIVLLKNDFQDYKNQIILLNDEITKFNKKNNTKMSKKLIPANSRNASSGLIRYINMDKGLKSSNWAIKKISIIKNDFLYKLHFFAYQIPNALNINFAKQNDVLNFLIKNKFLVNKNFYLSNNIFEVKNFLDTYKNKLKNLEYEADGIVVKVNDLKYQRLLGYTNKSPRWAIAFKYKSLEKITKIQNIFITIGRTGKVTYNAQLDPVEINGSIIKFATLHNYEYVKKLNLNIGCKVKVIKSGGVIPKIISNEDDNKNNTFKKIFKCPFCNSLLYQRKDQVDDYCININCPSIIKYSLMHFCQKDAMNIIGLGENLIEKLLNEKIITNIKDLYALANNDSKGILLQNKFLKAINVSEKQKIVNPEDSKILKKIILSIQESKNNSLERLLFSLNILNLGQKNAKIIAAHFNDLDNIMNANPSDFLLINGIGEELSNSIFNFFSLDTNKDLIQYLKSQGINFKYLISKNIDTNNIFYKKNFLITGSFSISRSALKSLIEVKGGNYLSSVSKNLNYLIVGDNPGTKLSKAKELNIEIIDKNMLEKHLNKS